MIADRLRKSILQAAIQGKLTEQLPEDGDARDMLSEIKAEKERLIKEGKIKKENAIPEITEDEIPFDIPENWCWVRIREVLELVNGRAYSQDELLPNGKYKVLRVGNFFTNEHWYYSNMELLDEKYCNNGDLLYAWSASFGPRIWDGNKTIFHYHIWNVNYFSLYRDYVYYFLLRDVDWIKASTTGSTMIHISMKNMLPRLIPIPPLQEQKRIVERLKEILPIIDELKKDETKLNALQKSFPKKMKDSLLQSAIQGKLTEHMESDGNAHNLVKDIQKEKARLIQEGKIKKEKLLPAITEDEIPFDIPENWCWVRLGNVLQVNPRNNLEDDMEVSFVPMTLISEGYINRFESENRIWKSIKSGFTHFAENDVVLAKITPCFQNLKSAVMSNLVNGFGAGTTELHVLRRYNSQMDCEYLLYFLKNPLFIKDGLATMKGTAGQQRVSTDFIRECLFPLPPHAEQQRIVERLDQLLPLCDALE